MMAISARNWPAACGKDGGCGVKADQSEREKLSGVISDKAFFKRVNIRCGAPAPLMAIYRCVLSPDPPEKIGSFRCKEHH
jgi:hypothetical protein